ncbi:hypothetical protein C8J57DRAFT_1233671 [Mycena rebaudengoi]|nr:hypothetical protein C8J57DRAFT_1233671 [Mycena rebaudengoi]
MCRSEDLRTSCKRRGLEGHRGRQEADESGGPSLRTAPSGLDGAKDEKRRAACGAVQHKTSLRRVFPVLRYTLSEAQTPSQRDRYSAPGTLQPQSQLVLLEPASFLPVWRCVPWLRAVLSTRQARAGCASHAAPPSFPVGFQGRRHADMGLTCGARVVRFCALPAIGNVVYADVAGGHTLRSVGARLRLRRMGMCIDRRRRTYGQAGGTRTTSVMYAGGGTLRACALPLGPGRWLWAACGVTLSTCAQATPVMVMPSAGGTRTTSWHQRTPPMHTTPASSTAATYNHGPH